MSGVAVSLLALVTVREPALHSGGKTTIGKSLQLARYMPSYRSRWKDLSDDKGAELDNPMEGFKGSRRGSGYKPDFGGYNSDRIRRFWSHYHGARPQPKEKPLERQPRGD